MRQGDRVRIAHHDLSFYERLHGYNQLVWNSRMATYVGKVGIVKDATMKSVQVAIFSWGISNDSTTTSTTTAVAKLIRKNNPERKNQPKIARNAVIEATYSWHPKSVLQARNLCMLDGDRAIMIPNKDLSKAVMVSIRVLDEETLMLRMPRSESLIWKQSENLNDVILPIYSGRNLSTLMHDRNLPIRLVNINRRPERAVFGIVSHLVGVTDLMEALRHWAETGDEQLFRLILYYNPELRSAAVDGQTILMLAVEIGLWSATVALLCIGADMNVTDKAGNSLLHIAAKRGHKQIIEGLIIFLADEINCQNCNGETPLHCSILTGHLSCMDQLLNTPQINPNVQDNDGNTPLHLLASIDDLTNRSAMLNRLLSNVKIDQLIMNNDGLTPLQLAIIANQNEVVESMIRMKPALLISDDCYSLLPLHLAAAYGHINVLEIILKYCSDINKTTKANRTAIHFAVERWDGNASKDMQRLSCIQLLVSSGVTLNTRDCDGMTALHLAAQATHDQSIIRNNKVQIVLQMKKLNMRLDELAAVFRPQWPIAVMCFLIGQGADPQIRNRSGTVPLDLVTEPTLKSLFEQYAACRPSHPRSCIAMSGTVVPRTFDSTGVTMCTFNCDDNIADIVFIPCGHRVVCATCAENTFLKRCPVCYQQIIMAKNSNGELVEIGCKITQNEKRPNGDNIKMIDEAEIEKIAQEAVENAKKVAEQEKNEIVRHLRDKLEQLELEVTCAICMDQRCSVVFQCGHTACVECSSPAKLKLCHICRQSIKRRTTMYT